MSPSSAAPFAQTLHSITQIKFNELSNTSKTFAPKLDAVRSIRADAALAPEEKIRQIIEKNTSVNPTDDAARPAGDKPTIKRQKMMLQLSAHDASVSSSTVEGWAQALAAGFEREKQTQIYGELFAKMLQEWLVPAEEASADGEKVGRKEMHEQRQTFEEIVFNRNTTDAAAMKLYLDNLFCGTDEDRKHLEFTRKVPGR